MLPWRSTYEADRFSPCQSFRCHFVIADHPSVIEPFGRTLTLRSTTTFDACDLSFRSFPRVF
ncbi:hypothetical protein CGZ80_06815 [Rhodopirellula sp. MGV]|nr:hypothetical protein CGZ80_06815 [Rhodopirellula sp. MGV]PNY36183.1 hypothetical protein C2E31_13765 [Rhodopirellula baltica]